MGEPGWIDHLDQVVRDETVVVAGFSGTLAQVVLQQRQRAGEAGELDEDAVYHRGYVRPHDPGPPPGEESATNDEADEQQMSDDHKVSASSVPHQVTLQRPYPVRTWI